MPCAFVFAITTIALANSGTSIPSGLLETSGFVEHRLTDGTSVFRGRHGPVGITLYPGGFEIEVFRATGLEGAAFEGGDDDVLSVQDRLRQDIDPIQASRVAIRFESSGRLEGENRKPTSMHFLKGRDPESWRFDVPIFERVRCRDLYPGIDVVFYDNGKALEYDFIITSAGHLKDIVMHVDGASSLKTDADGSLLIETPLGTIRQPKPKTVASTMPELSRL